MTRILIADDNNQNLYTLESILKAYGYAVTCAGNGAEALELARLNRPDLIISDIFMPVMDGFALCHEWKTDEQLKNTPFIFYTATYTDSKDEKFALSLGAERFLVKPQEPEALIDAVQEVFGRNSEKVSAKPTADESETLREYNEVLFRKLEQKVEQLEKANADLREIPARLLAALEAERKRIGSELHDSIAQTLVAIKLKIETILKLRDDDPETAFRHLEEFIPTLQHSIDETRSICKGLRPPMLDDLGLLATIDWLCRDFMKLHPGIFVEFKTVLEESEIPENLKISIFRIMQESMNNATKHSRAKRVCLSLAKGGNRIELSVADEGIGMDLNYMGENYGSMGLGLAGMRERAELTGGIFSIESAYGQGTTVRASWPIGC